MDKKRDSATGLFLPLGDEPLDRKPLAIKVPSSLRQRLQSIPNWQSWARKILDEASRELMGNAPQATEAVPSSPGLDVSTKVELEDATNGPGEKPKRGRKPKGES